MVKTRLVSVRFCIRKSDVSAKMTVSEYMRAVLVAHLSLRAREREKTGVHCTVAAPRFDRAAKCPNLAYQLPVAPNRADTGNSSVEHWYYF